MKFNNLQWSLLDDKPRAHSGTHECQNDDWNENSSGGISTGTKCLSKELFTVFAGKVSSAIANNTSMVILLTESSILALTN